MDGSLPAGIALSGPAWHGNCFSRVFKNCASRRDPALRGYCKCLHVTEYAAFSKTSNALDGGPMLVFQHPDWRPRQRGVSYPL